MSQAARIGSKRASTCISRHRAEKPDEQNVNELGDLRRDESNTTSSIPIAPSGGPKARTSANTIASVREAPLMTRNSGLPFNIEKTGALTP